MEASAMILPGSTHIDWHHFEASLYDRFAVNAVTVTRTGERKTEGVVPWANALCALIKTNPIDPRTFKAMKRYIKGYLQ